jgi:hypothetical protein
MQWLNWSEHTAAGAVLILLGASLVLAGLRSIPGHARSVAGFRDWAPVYLYVFRRVVVGLCVVGAGAGVAAEVPWLLAASVCVGIGEWLESSYYLGVLRWAGGLHEPERERERWPPRVGFAGGGRFSRGGHP